MCRPKARQSFFSSALINAASEAMPLFRKQSAAQLPSLAPHDSKARLLSGRDSQGFMAKPCTPHPITRKGYATSVRQQSCQRLCNAQRVQSFKLQTRNVRGQGARPLAFSWGSKGAILSRERMAPLFRAAPAALLPLADCKESIPSCIIPRLW